MSGLNGSQLAVPKTIKMYIDGAFVRSESGRSYPVYVKGTKQLYANLCRGSRKDVRAAVTAAQEAQPGWSGRSAYNRGQILYRMAEMTESKRSEFVELMTETMGTTKAAAASSVTRAIDALVYFAGFADKYHQVLGSENPVSSPHYNFTCSEPVGVVGLLGGDTVDFDVWVGQLAAIICSGNTVVALMPELESALLAPLSEVLATSDLPKGVVNLLSGELDELRAVVASHMEIQSLCYMGDDSKVWSELKVLGAENMKRVVAPGRETMGLESISGFLEFKTVWHPIGT
ncbi:MAG: aldehyde dehydrogenase family protein [Bdellovibrionales bacterium]|nr:aldehyde dehydrogenase family protein [Bdellovibrionales bacterium]